MQLELTDDEAKLLLIDTSRPEGHQLSERLSNLGVHLGHVAGNHSLYIRVRTDHETNEEIRVNQEMFDRKMADNEEREKARRLEASVN